MSPLVYIVFLLLLVLAAVGSWKAALYWHVRTRDARDEDPRDQEIRELSAALSIARKELARLEDERTASSTQAHELTSKLEHASSSLSDIKEKFNATKEHLNKEIEQRQELNEELAVLRRELDQTKARNTELEVQSRMDVTGSELIAGMDMLADDNDSEALTQQIASLEKEVARWKQHCSVLTKTNKSLRAQLDLTESCAGKR